MGSASAIATMRPVSVSSTIAALSLCVGSLASCGEPEWVLATTPNFKVLSDAGEKSARQVARELEQVRTVFEQILSVKVTVIRPVTVIAARDEQTARRLLREEWNRRGRFAGAFLDGGTKYWALVRLDTADTMRTVWHEYIHLMVAARYGSAPLWLNEGLAEFYSSARVSGDDVTVGVIQDHLLHLREHTMFPVDKLVAVDQGSPEYEDEAHASVFYAESSVLTHYLLVGDGGKYRSRLAEYLKLLAENEVDDRTAMQQAFGGAGKLQTDLWGYVQRPSFNAFKGRFAFPEDQTTVRTLRPAQASSVLADFLLDTGAWGAARGQIEAALAAEPDLAEARLQHARLLVREGQMEKAAVAFSEAMRGMPSSVLARYYFGTTPGLPGVDDKAREAALRKAVELAPGYAPAHTALAELLLGTGRPEDARVAALAAFAADPAHVDTLLTLLRAASKLERRQEVERVERILLQLVRTDRDALPALVGHHEAQGAPERAEALLKRVRRQSPRNLVAVRLHASFLEGQKRPDEAEAVLREGLAVERKTPDLLNYLAYLNADRGVKLDEALKLIDQALKIRPGDEGALDTKGWVLFRLGRVKEAEAFVRQSLAAREEPVVRDHLGDILAKAGRRAEALECWRQALSHPAVDDKLKAAVTTKIEKAASLAAN